jgi:hypothetical protein
MLIIHPPLTPPQRVVDHQGMGLFINPLPWWERAGVRGVL